jgi:hypothetical protein
MAGSLVATEDLVAGLAGDAELAAYVRTWPRPREVWPQSEDAHPLPTTPSTAYTPPRSACGKVLPMCPVRYVTHLSGRSQGIALIEDCGPGGPSRPPGSGGWRSRFDGARGNQYHLESVVRNCPQFGRPVYQLLPGRWAEPFEISVPTLRNLELDLPRVIARFLPGLQR